MKRNIEDKNIVVKGNGLINAISDYKYSKNELKMICTLVSQINNKFDNEFSKKWIRISDLDFGSEENVKNTNHCINLCKKIMTKPFMIDGSIYNWFTKLTPKKGIIEYQFHDDLKPFLLQLNEQFTKYSINNILNLNSEYSIILYELLTQYLQIGERNITLKDLRKILHIPESYKNNDIKRLIESIQKDMKANTSIQFDFKMVKVGAQFVSVDFIIKNNKKLENIKYIK